MYTKNMRERGATLRLRAIKLYCGINKHTYNTYIYTHTHTRVCIYNGDLNQVVIFLIWQWNLAITQPALLRVFYAFEWWSSVALYVNIVYLHSAQAGYSSRAYFIMSDSGWVRANECICDYIVLIVKGTDYVTHTYFNA